MDEYIERAFARKYLPQWLGVGTILLLIISGFVWWTQVYENPYNVYWGMLSNSLTLSSVTKHTSQMSNGNSLSQYTTLNFGTSNLVYGRTVLKNATSTVNTESIGTFANDYVRYTNIKTSQKDQSGKNLNFSSVLGKWAKAPANNSSSQSGSAPFFIQTLLGIEGGNLVPMANLTVNNRHKLIQELHQSVVLKTSFSDVKRHIQNGRSIYTYPVDIEPVAYVAFEKDFGSMMGLKTLQNVDPNNYQNQQAIHVTFDIDARSHHLVAIGYPGANHSETYGSYGILAPISLPTRTISDAKLQSLLGQVH